MRWVTFNLLDSAGYSNLADDCGKASAEYCDKAVTTQMTSCEGPVACKYDNKSGSISLFADTRKGEIRDGNTRTYTVTLLQTDLCGNTAETKQTFDVTDIASEMPSAQPSAGPSSSPSSMPSDQPSTFYGRSFKIILPTKVFLPDKGNSIEEFWCVSLSVDKLPKSLKAKKAKKAKKAIKPFLRPCCSGFDSSKPQLKSAKNSVNPNHCRNKELAGQIWVFDEYYQLRLRDHPNFCLRWMDNLIYIDVCPIGEEVENACFNKILGGNWLAKQTDPNLLVGYKLPKQSKIRKSLALGLYERDGDTDVDLKSWSLEFEFY